MMVIQFFLQYHDVTIHSQCMSQIDFFQTQTTAYKPLAKNNDKLKYQITEKKFLKNFFFFFLFFFKYFREFSF